MTKEEFIKWFDSTTCFESLTKDGCTWREMVDYADYRFDYVYVYEDSVTFEYEELYWGGKNNISRDYTFEEFKEAYKNDSLKY
jgi:hypothetical protein